MRRLTFKLASSGSGSLDRPELIMPCEQNAQPFTSTRKTRHYRTRRTCGM
jgi:hypothetical protein